MLPPLRVTASRRAGLWTSAALSLRVRDRMASCVQTNAARGGLTT